MRHPSPSVIPSLSRAMGLMAIVLPLCWEPFGWSATLPADLKWESNDTDPVYADPEARRGGTFRDFMSSFPLTCANTGPTPNGGFAGYVRETNLPLLSTHPLPVIPPDAGITSGPSARTTRPLYFSHQPQGTLVGRPARHHR